jgi:hypothetical protein
VGEGKGTKERERVVGKAAGDECVFIPGEGTNFGRLVLGLFEKSPRLGRE